MNSAYINTGSLIAASSLVMVAVMFSYYQRLKLEKEILVSMVRAVLQLLAVGYVLEYIFGMKNPLFTTLLILFMTVNAALNAAKRGEGIANGFAISFVSILAGAAVSLSVLLLSGSIKYEPYQMIPVSGMVISNAMIALGLCFRDINSLFRSRREEVEVKLSLGADMRTASKEIIRDSIRTAMLPTIDSAKTMGIVALPGTMTGLILAGTSPIVAVKYQIMVQFMLFSTTSIASLTACYLSYRKFFNERQQLK
jgi:putative ABC transport system permease protein